jgi:type I restriction enzyme S subunit
MMMYQTNAKKIRSDYLVFAIASEPVQTILLKLAGGSTVGHLKVGDIRNLPIPHPVGIDEQTQVASVLSDAMATQRTLTSNLEKLTSLKVAMMQDLLTGRKRVTALLNSAPAN